MTKSKTPAAHPGFSKMIPEAIVALKSRTGSSRAAILNYISANYKIETANPAINIRLSLKRLVESGALKMAKASGKGAGCYKVVKVEKPQSEGEEGQEASTKETKDKKGCQYACCQETCFQEGSKEAC